TANAGIGDITLVQGWNWYDGANPSGIKPGQFDFQTVLTHELGHVLGLQHSANPNSVMHETLSAGSVIRNLTRHDLHGLRHAAAHDVSHSMQRTVADAASSEFAQIAGSLANGQAGAVLDRQPGWALSANLLSNPAVALSKAIGDWESQSQVI